LGNIIFYNTAVRHVTREYIGGVAAPPIYSLMSPSKHRYSDQSYLRHLVFTGFKIHSAFQSTLYSRIVQITQP